MEPNGTWGENKFSAPQLPHTFLWKRGGNHSEIARGFSEKRFISYFFHILFCGKDLGERNKMKLDIKEKHVRDAIYYLAFFSKRKNNSKRKGEKKPKSKP